MDNVYLKIHKHEVDGGIPIDPRRLVSLTTHGFRGEAFGELRALGDSINVVRKVKPPETVGELQADLKLTGEMLEKVELIVDDLKIHFTALNVLLEAVTAPEGKRD